MSLVRVTGFDRAGVYIGLSGYVLDRASKVAADMALKDQRPITLVDGFLSLQYARNEGGMFGVLDHAPTMLKLVATRLLPAALVLVLIAAYLKTPAASGTLRAALAFMCVGTLGNLFDRLKHGGVIDFINLHMGRDGAQLTINIADLYIAAGVLLLAWHFSAAPSTQSLERP